MRRHCITNIIMAIMLLALREAICREFTNEEGPYEAHVFNISECAAQPPWLRTNVTTYTTHGRSLLRGKIVMHRPVKNVKFTVQLHYIEQGKVKVFDLKNKNCHSVIVQVVFRALGMPFNFQRCTMEPTTTEFSNLDVNAVMHTVVQSLWYGTALIRWEATMPAAPIVCLEIYMQIGKVNGNGVKTT